MLLVFRLKSESAKSLQQRNSTSAPVNKESNFSQYIATSSQPKRQSVRNREKLDELKIQRKAT